MKKIPITDMDYVELHAEKLKENNALFEEQKRFIESQLFGNRSLNTNMFGKGNSFKKKCREYLKKLGKI